MFDENVYVQGHGFSRKRHYILLSRGKENSLQNPRVPADKKKPDVTGCTAIVLILFRRQFASGHNNSHQLNMKCKCNMCHNIHKIK